MQFDNAKRRGTASLFLNFSRKSFLGILVLLLILNSCSKDKYEAQVPTYISIDNITLQTNYLNEGSASANITDAWVYINDDLVGVFELPATFPVLKEGNLELKVYAGIKDNGIAATRARYLMYAPHIEQINLVKGETIKINPTIGYNTSVNFRWMEDFESASQSFLYASGNDTIINKQSTTVKEGNFSGFVSLDAGMDFFEATSVGYNNIPHNGSPVYLEMDFIANEYILVGLYIDNTQYAVLTLNTTADWKKIYVNLTDLINTKQNASEIKVFFGIKSTSSNPFLSTNPKVYIDNIKLVHY
jgi:hypothetical protein